MDLSQITPLILTRNEAANIGRTLSRLQWASRIIVIDSDSDDATPALARKFANVRLVTRKFDDHAKQWNFGLGQVNTRWVLTLDADYLCSSKFVEELKALPDADAVYVAQFRYCVHGKALRAALYPPRPVLFNPRRNAYVQDGHTQRLVVEDPKLTLATPLLHDDRKSLSSWCAAQVRYAELEASKLLTRPTCNLGIRDRIRRWCVVAPFLNLFYCLVIKRLVFDGPAGWHYSMQRFYAEWLLGMALLERKLQRPVERNRMQPMAPAQATLASEGLEKQ
ncbi:MAG TPA: glycosyltransferase family 2 protein [Lacipirellula sp.]